jgi:hypothetical protein
MHRCFASSACTLCPSITSSHSQPADAAGRRSAALLCGNPRGSLQPLAHHGMSPSTSCSTCSSPVPSSSSRAFLLERIRQVIADFGLHHSCASIRTPSSSSSPDTCISGSTQLPKHNPGQGIFAALARLCLIPLIGIALFVGHGRESNQSRDQYDLAGVVRD